MSDPDRWQQLFPDAVQADVTAHIEGESYFDAVAKAIGTTKGKDHLVFITGWMMDVRPDKSANRIYSKFLAALEDAAKRRVKIIILIWNNPTYIKKLEELKNWGSSASMMYD